MTDPDLNDELNPQHELASAYLDGVASPAERAQIEASPELLTLVASFAAVRIQLAEVPATAGDHRDAAIASALAEFDYPALAPTSTDSAIIPLRAKRRWARPVLSVAAAVLLAGAIGLAAKGGLSGGDKSSSATLDSSAKVASADPANESRMTSDTMAAMAPSTIGSIGGSAQAALVIDTPEQLAALAVTTTADIPGATAGSPDGTAAASDTTASVDTNPPSTPAEFTSSTRNALGCLTSQQEFLADIQYQGTFAIAARDTVSGMISAIADDCTVLATVGP